MRFDGKTALVTGAARGIGLAIAERLLGEGARVALVDRDPEVEAVAKRLGSAARALVADVTLTADVERAKAEGRLAVGFDVEGMAPIEDELALVSTFYDLGVRWMLIAYNRTNKIGGGCHDQDPGLTGLGREVCIAESDRLADLIRQTRTNLRPRTA